MSEYATLYRAKKTLRAERFVARATTRARARARRRELARASPARQLARGNFYFHPRRRTTMVVDVDRASPPTPTPTPTVTKWSQRRGRITLRYDARDVADARVEVTRANNPSGGSLVRVSFTAIDSTRAGETGETSSARPARCRRDVSLELYGAVADASRAETKITDRSLTVTLLKTNADASHWPRLTLSAVKTRLVVVDFDSWLDEDDERAAEAAFKFDLHSLEHIGNYEDKAHYFPDVRDSDDDMPDMTDIYA